MSELLLLNDQLGLPNYGFHIFRHTMSLMLNAGANWKESRTYGTQIYFTTMDIYAELDLYREEWSSRIF